MLIHEWMRYRDRQVKRPEPELIESPAPEAEEADQPLVPDHAPVGEELLAAPAPPPAPLLPFDVEAEEEAAVLASPLYPAAPEPPVEELFEAPIAGSARRQAEAVAALQVSDFQSRRLQALLAKQQRLPLEVEEPEAPARRGTPEPAESREDLIERLLDPVLSINEAATLLGVCSTSIRRYTNRGVLRCFRTPGNQRRFRLSDVLDFMELQQQEPVD
ncbi:MAG TPA: helix-turn-helix domain-containing protein [Armatimonadota bacterium]|jgi:excisionase family DNA binding protein